MVELKITDDSAWAMLQAFDLWGDDFQASLHLGEDFAAWRAVTPADIVEALAVSSVTGDIANGGVEQCFWNSFGTAAPEALVVLRKLELNDYADLLEKAIARFGPNFPRDRERRMSLLDSGEVELLDIDEVIVPLIISSNDEYDRKINGFVAEVLVRN